ncbi:hypothetical protein TSUD_261260 [Trifolium subterraneum]|nr:hypothetical protein TSUD_261260 [Trifolium subterraneum]
MEHQTLKIETKVIRVEVLSYGGDEKWKVGVDDGLSGGFGSTGSPCNGADILKFASLDGLVLEAVLDEHAGCIVVACKSG